MGCLGKKALCFLLVFGSMYVRGTPLQEAGSAGQRKPFFERLRRLEEQLRRLQEVTLTHLQGIANNYNVSYNVDARFQSLAEEMQAMATAMNQSQVAVQGDMAHLKAWVRKTQRRSRKVDARLQALGVALSARSRSGQRGQEGTEQKAQEEAALSQALQDSLASLTQQVQSQGARLAALEGQLQAANPDIATPELTPTQLVQTGSISLQLPRDSQIPRPSPQLGNPPQDFTTHLHGTWKFPAPGSHQAASKDASLPAWTHQGSGKICNVGPVLVFPNASTENAVFLRPGFHTALRALSICGWVRTTSSYLGTLLSYATQDNDNKLVLHGRNSMVPGSIHLVIGDPAFRELALQQLLDGQWHHMCVIWTSTEGRYWLHVDRRLVATGSRFREGYEIPPGGSLVLGQEQDAVGGGFDSSEAFVGSISGLAIWNRTLVAGEVANLATGKELPTGAILTLADAVPVGRVIRRPACTCLEHCP